MITNIVIAEDESELQSVYSEYLSTDFEVDIFENGSGILEHFKKGASVDLIITDIQMPVMNGLSVVHFFKKQKSFISHIPILVLTALYDERVLKKSKELGADDIIVKPFQLPDLKSRIKSKLRKKIDTAEFTSLLKRCHMPSFSEIKTSGAINSRFRDPKVFLIADGTNDQFRVLINRGHSITNFSEEQIEKHVENVEIYHRDERTKKWVCIWPTFISGDLFSSL